MNASANPTKSDRNHYGRSTRDRVRSAPSRPTRRRSGTVRRQVFRTMITPAAWSNQAFGASVRRLSGGVRLAVGDDPSGGKPPEQVKPVAARASARCDSRERFGWGSDRGAKQ